MRQSEKSYKKSMAQNTNFQVFSIATKQYFYPLKIPLWKNRQILHIHINPLEKHFFHFNSTDPKHTNFTSQAHSLHSVTPFYNNKSFMDSNDAIKKGKLANASLDLFTRPEYSLLIPINSGYRWKWNIKVLVQSQVALIHKSFNYKASCCWKTLALCI